MARSFHQSFPLRRIWNGLFFLIPNISVDLQLRAAVDPSAANGVLYDASVPATRQHSVLAAPC